MLYLVRKINASVVINNEIEIKVVAIKGNSVKLGIVFPKGNVILRKEVFDAMSNENTEALHSFEEGNL